MIELRIYRAAFLPAVVAVIVSMFSLQPRPEPVPQGLAADVLFEGRVAAAAARSVVEAHPDRRAGTAGGRDSARWVGERLAEQGFATALQRFGSEGKRLVNVVARRPGASARQIVLAVPRDARSVPDAAGSATDTGALIEIARALEGRATRKTLVLASIDGSQLGSAGARRLASDLGDPASVEAVLVASALGAKDPRGPLLVPWSESERRTGLRLQRTAGDSVRQELASGAGRGPGLTGQFARIGFPVALGDQGALLDAGFNALRLSGGGELPPPSATAADADRLGMLGRAALRVVSAYDAAPAVDERPSAFLLVARNVLPGWAVALLAAALIVPALIAGVDSLARVRRRREAVLPWFRWLLAGAVSLMLGVALAEFLVLVGQAPNPPVAPPAPGRFALDGSAALSLGLCAAVVVAAWVWLRPWLAGRRGERAAAAAAGAPGAAVAAMLVLVAVTIGVWVVNPFAALLLLPPLHLWLLATSLPAAPARPAAVALFLAGLVPTVWILVSWLVRMSLDPLEGAWYLFLLITGHHIGLYTVVLVALWLAAAAAVVAVLRSRRPKRREPAASQFGPGKLLTRA